MKRTFAILTVLFAFALTTSAYAASQPQQRISKKQLQTMIDNARTPAEHQQIADYYSRQSQKFLAEADQHVEMRADYLNGGSRGSHSHADHCSQIIRQLKEKSVKAAALATEHEQMAREAAQK